jgi:2,3-bisphosphoglycerate-independent phosphoglycerate mutase
MKYIVLLGDGMADYPLEEHHGKTPLEISSTPAMDGLAARGAIGMVKTVPDGMPPGSDVANLSVMGYDPKRYYTGRAPIEAASIGVQLVESDVAFRCNLVTIGERGGSRYMKDYSAGHISTPEARELIGILKEQLDSEEITFYPGVSYRHLMVWRGGSAAVCAVPPHDISDRDIEPHMPSGDGAPFVTRIMEQSRSLLDAARVNRTRMQNGQNPANAVWLWGQGTALRIPSFMDLYGVSGGVVSAVDLIKGLGISAGLTSIDVPGATGYLDTNYEGKVSAAMQALDSGNFVYVHVEAPDETSHKGCLDEKIKAIEDFDRKIVQPVLDGCRRRGEPFRILVLPDHPTPLSLKTHTADPVPFIIYSSENEQAPGTARYCEKDARMKGLFVGEGWQLMGIFIKGEGI